MAWMPKEFGAEAWLPASAPARPAGRRWRFEALEDRRLLAAQYDFAVNLYADAGGVPGELLAGDTVQAGESFFVEITAEDLRPGGLGLRSMGLHVGWDPQVLREIDEPFDPRDPADHADDLVVPVGASRRAGQRSRPDQVLDRRAFASGAGRAIGAAARTVCLLHFRALQAAEYTPLFLEQPSGAIGFIPMKRPFSLDELVFESQLITVTPSSVTPALPPDTDTGASHPVADGGSCSPAGRPLLDLDWNDSSGRRVSITRRPSSSREAGPGRRSGGREVCQQRGPVTGSPGCQDYERPGFGTGILGCGHPRDVHPGNLRSSDRRPATGAPTGRAAATQHRTVRPGPADGHVCEHEYGCNPDTPCDPSPGHG